MFRSGRTGFRTEFLDGIDVDAGPEWGTEPVQGQHGRCEMRTFGLRDG